MPSKYIFSIFNNIEKHLFKKPYRNFCNQKSNFDDCNLPTIPLKENVNIKKLPSIETNAEQFPMSIPTMVSTLFSQRIENLFKELLLYDPIKQPIIFGKQAFNTNAEFSDKGMTIAVDMKGFKEEDISVNVDGQWLVIEGQSSVTVPENEGGGLHVRHIIRRYEIPPNSDVSNIKSSFKQEVLTVIIPSLQPKSANLTPRPTFGRRMIWSSSSKNSGPSTNHTPSKNYQGIRMDCL